MSLADQGLAAAALAAEFEARMKAADDAARAAAEAQQAREALQQQDQNGEGA